MVAAGVLLSILVLVVLVAIPLALRSLVANEKRTESPLHDSHTPTVTYAIPNGIDPAVFAVGLKKAGYLSIVTDVGTAQGLRVRCDAGDREPIRRTLEGVVVTTYDGAEMTVDHVVFEDER